MSSEKDFQGDFEPVRIATAEEIKQEALQRTARRNYGKKHADDSGLTASTSGDSKQHDSDNKTSKKDDLGSTSLDSSTGGPNKRTRPVSHKRKLYLTGQKELKQYLEEKRLKKLKKEHANEEKADVTKPSTPEKARKRRKLVLKPMDETHKRMILDELEAKKVKNKQNKHPVDSNKTSKGDDELSKKDPSVKISDSSGLEFEDASQQLHDSRFSINSPSFPDVSGIVDPDSPGNIEPGRSELMKEENTRHFEKSDMDDGEVERDGETVHEGDFHATMEDVNRMRRLILSQLNGIERLPIEKTSLLAPFKEMHSIFSHTIHDLESHTVLLTGAPGSGKTEVIEQALAKLQELNSEKYITIRLSGSLHFTDQHAIREIARQLDVKLKDFNDPDGDSGDDTYEQRAISETFHNILSTLFRLDEPAEPEEEKELPIRVIFILDEIEKFTGNPKQTLLYNLFELAQVSKVPMCIVGITPKVTVREHFEKRVRSRFSQRMVQTKKADSLETFWQNAKIALTVSDEKIGEFVDLEYPKQWNTRVETLFKNRSGLTQIVYRIYYATKSYRQVNNECALPISRISELQPFPLSADFETYGRIAVHGIEGIIASLSTAELIMVVAAARWIAKSDPPHVNFKLAYREYTEMLETNNTESTTLSSKTSYIDNLSLTAIKITRNAYSAKVVRGCWGVLYRMGLLFDVISANNETNTNNNANLYKEAMIDDSKMLQLDVTLEELAKLVPEDSYVRRFTRL